MVTSFLASCWFQPIWKILVTLDHFPKYRGENYQIFELPTIHFGFFQTWSMFVTRWQRWPIMMHKLKTKVHRACNLNPSDLSPSASAVGSRQRTGFDHLKTQVIHHKNPLKNVGFGGPWRIHYVVGGFQKRFVDTIINGSSSLNR